MKRLTLPFLFIVCFHSTASAQALVVLEEKNLISQLGYSFNVSAYVEKDVHPYLNVFAFGLVSQNWAQIYGGLQIKTCKYFNFGFGGGIEQTKNLWRTSFSLGLNLEPVSFSGVFELGAGGWWFTSTLKFKFNTYFSAGAIAERFSGIGIYLETTLPVPKLPIVLWGAPVYDFESKTYGALLGIKFIL